MEYEDLVLKSLSQLCGEHAYLIGGSGINTNDINPGINHTGTFKSCFHFNASAHLRTSGGNTGGGRTLKFF